MNTTFRSLFACAAAGALAVSLAACGPEEQETTSSQMALADGLAPGWSMMDLAAVDPAVYEGADAPLPQALPMAASYDGGGYGYAPMYDYAPDDSDSYYEPLDDSYYYGDGYDDGYYYDEGYYDDAYYDDGYGNGGILGFGGDSNGLGLLAVAAVLAGVLGDAPPDYGFAYDGVSPWAWETGDRYYRYAEPVYGGYRYYYYEPDAYHPFFVSDPYYSYGYRDDRIVAIYDRGGRRIDARRARLQLQAAKSYYARAEQLHRAAQYDRYGVPAPLWERQRDKITRDRNDWVQKATRRPAVQQWVAHHAPKVQKHWANEALVRRDAERRFADWQRADYRTPAPKFYTPQVRQEQVSRIANLRQDRAKEIANLRQERTEKQREVRQEAQRLAQRAERVAPRDKQPPARQSVTDRFRGDDRRAVAAAPVNRAAEGASGRQDAARAAVAARRDEQKVAQSQRAANRVANERRENAAKAARQTAPVKAVARQEGSRSAGAQRSAAQARAKQQEAQQRQKAQQQAQAERAKQTAAKQQQERSTRQAQVRANADKQERARQASANSARQAAERREAQAKQQQARAEQRRNAQAAERQQAQQRQRAQAEQKQRAQADQRQAQAEQRRQAQAAQRQQAQQRQRAEAEQKQRAQSEQRQRAQAEQRQAQAQQRQSARNEERQQARQERQNGRDERRAQRRGGQG